MRPSLSTFLAQRSPFPTKNPAQPSHQLDFRYQFKKKTNNFTTDY